MLLAGLLFLLLGYFLRVHLLVVLGWVFLALALLLMLLGGVGAMSPYGYY